MGHRESQYTFLLACQRNDGKIPTQCYRELINAYIIKLQLIQRANNIGHDSIIQYDLTKPKETVKRDKS